MVGGVGGTRVKKTFASPRETAALNADPEVVPLVRRQRELERELREVKERLECVEQAGKIERDSKGKEVVDGELIELVGKWRGASRAAAEELFGKVRDRVNRYVSHILSFLGLGWESEWD